MIEKGVGRYQITKSTDSTKRILDTLRDQKEHRYQELQKQTSLSTATLSKHLKRLEKSGLVEKRIDLDSSEYPYPVYYRANARVDQFNQKIFPDFPRVYSHKLKDKISVLIMQKQPRYYIHVLNALTSFGIVRALQGYFQDSVRNEDLFNGAMDYYIMSDIRDYIQNLRLRLEELAEKGEDVEQILADCIENLHKDYRKIPSLSKTLNKVLG